MMVDLLTNLAELFNYQEYDGDLDEKEYGLVIMMLLEDFIKKYSSKSYSYVEKHFDSDCEQLQRKLLQMNDKQFKRYEEAQCRNQLLEHNIPEAKHKLVKLDYDLQTTKKVVETTIKNTIQSLRNEIKLNIQVVNDRSDEDSFNLQSKLKESIKRIKKAVQYSTNMTHQKVKREVNKFHYGEDALYRWVTKGDDKVCAWCLSEERKPPRRLEELPFDHFNGRCDILPSNPEATAEYNLIVYGDENGRND